MPRQKRANVPGEVFGSRNPHLLWGRPRIPDADRRTLARLGLTESQIEAVQEIIGGVVLSLRSGPTTTQIREALQRMDSALGEAEDAFRAVSVLTDDDGLGLALRKLLEREHRSDRSFPEDLDVLLDQLIRMRFTVKPAVKRMGTAKQARQRTANPFPISLIDNALHPHEFSLGGKAFREICGIVYRAATGVADYDPEKAIAAYRAARKRQVLAGSGN